VLFEGTQAEFARKSLRVARHIQI